MAASSTTLRVAIEPSVAPSVGFKTVDQVHSVVFGNLDSGDFYYPALLARRMRANPRLRAALQTRALGLISTKIRWNPIRNNRDARAAARALTEDWRWMAPAPQRIKLHESGLLLGTAFAQRIAVDSPTSGRRLFRLRPYWTGWGKWNDQKQRYVLQVRGENRFTEIESPALSLRPTIASASPWIVHEPFGEHSYLEGLMHALWHMFLGSEQSTAILWRACEKSGIGLIKLLFSSPAPDTNDDEPGGEDELKQLALAIARASRDGVVPLEQFDEESGRPSFGMEPFEFSGVGHELIANALNVAAISFAIVLLGHNLTTEVKGGSYAAASVGENVRTDIKAGDNDTEEATLHPQLVQPWAEANFGDPELAPERISEVDPPAVNQQMAQTYQQLGLAIRELKAQIPNLDEQALAERFRLPLKVLEKTQAQVPAAAPPATEPAPTNDEEVT